MQSDETVESPGQLVRKPWVAPSVETDTIYETRALGCCQCLNRDQGTELGWDPTGGCEECIGSVSNY